MNQTVQNKITSMTSDCVNNYHVLTSITAEQKKKLEDFINGFKTNAFDATAESGQKVFGIDNLMANNYATAIFLRTEPLSESGKEQARCEIKKQMRTTLLGLSEQEKAWVDSFISDSLSRPERRLLNKIKECRESEPILGKFAKDNYFLYLVVAYAPTP